MRMLKWQSDCHITLNENSTWHKIWGICKRQLRWRLFFSELKRRLMTLSTQNLWVLSGNQNLCQCFLFLHFWYDMIITTITMWCVLYNVLKCIHAPFLCPPVPRYLSVPVPQIRFIISNQLKVVRILLRCAFLIQLLRGAARLNAAPTVCGHAPTVGLYS